MLKAPYFSPRALETKHERSSNDSSSTDSFHSALLASKGFSDEFWFFNILLTFQISHFSKSILNSLRNLRHRPQHTSPDIPSLRRRLMRSRYSSLRSRRRSEERRVGKECR